MNLITSEGLLNLFRNFASLVGNFRRFLCAYNHFLPSRLPFTDAPGLRVHLVGQSCQPLSCSFPRTRAHELAQK